MSLKLCQFSIGGIQFRKKFTQSSILWQNNLHYKAKLVHSKWYYSTREGQDRHKMKEGCEDKKYEFVQATYLSKKSPLLIEFIYWTRYRHIQIMYVYICHQQSWAQSLQILLEMLLPSAVCSSLNNKANLGRTVILISIHFSSPLILNSVLGEWFQLRKLAVRQQC